MVRVAPLLKRVDDGRIYLADGLSAEEALGLRRHERTGRPLGDRRFVERLEQTLGRILCKSKPGRRPKRKTK